MRNSIHSIKLLLLSVLCTLFSVGCSAGSDDSIAAENLGDVSQELACTYPLGAVGRTDSPPIGKVTTFGEQASKNALVIYTLNAGGTFSGLLKWDPASLTNMSGSWTGSAMTTLAFRVAGPDVYIDVNLGQPDAASIKFTGSTGAPIGSAITMNGGVTRIEATNNATGNYRALKFTGWHQGALVSFTRAIPSSGGC